MIRQLFLVFLSLCFFVSQASADNGFVSVKSSHNVKGTADRLENALKQKGMTVFIRIDHSQNARKVGKKLRPTELLIFGNPKVGTPLMQCAQSIAIDLPQKALIWQDESGEVWLSYNDPKFVATRHDIVKCVEVIKKVGNVLRNFADVATKS